MNKDMIGTYGEYFCVTRLLSWGYPATIVPGPFTYDVVVDINGKPLRIQVKTTNRESSRGGSFEWNCRHSVKNKAYSEGDYDIMACVAVPNYRMIFLPFHKKQIISRSCDKLNREEERKSWETCLDTLGLIK